jgi:translation initiation factor IF-1
LNAFNNFGLAEPIIPALVEEKYETPLVTETLPDVRFRVPLDAVHEVIAYTAGKMKKRRIKTLAGDRVTIEMSPYDLEKGRLIFRHKDERASVGRRPPPRSQFRRR